MDKAVTCETVRTAGMIVADIARNKSSELYTGDIVSKHERVSV